MYGRKSKAPTVSATGKKQPLSIALALVLKDVRAKVFGCTLMFLEGRLREGHRLQELIGGTSAI